MIRKLKAWYHKFCYKLSVRCYKDGTISPKEHRDNAVHHLSHYAAYHNKASIDKLKDLEK